MISRFAIAVQGQLRVQARKLSNVQTADKPITNLGTWSAQGVATSNRRDTKSQQLPGIADVCEKGVQVRVGKKTGRRGEWKLMTEVFGHFVRLLRATRLGQKGACLAYEVNRTSDASSALNIIIRTCSHLLGHQPTT